MLQDIVNDYYGDLGDWDQRFIDRMQEHMPASSTGVLCDEDFHEYVSPRQQEQIKRIWKKVNPNP